MTGITPAKVIGAAMFLGLPCAGWAQDCSGFIGNFRGADAVIFAITDAGDGNLTITAPDGATATAACLPPLVRGENEYPQAQATGLVNMPDVAFGEPDCCVMTLNGNQITFSPGGRFWQRRPD